MTTRSSKGLTSGIGMHYLSHRERKREKLYLQSAEFLVWFCPWYLAVWFPLWSCQIYQLCEKGFRGFPFYHPRSSQYVRADSVCVCVFKQLWCFCLTGAPGAHTWTLLQCIILWLATPSQFPQRLCFLSVSQSSLDDKLSFEGAFSAEIMHGPAKNGRREALLSRLTTGQLRLILSNLAWPIA